MIPLIAMFSVVTFVLAAYYSPLALRITHTELTRRRLSKQREIVLTYDDGPSPSLTPLLLDLLQKHNAKATFFLLGRNARQFPAVVDRIIKDGHDIGCHSDQHLNAWKALPWAAIKDTENGYRAISRWTTSDCAFRPPYGKMTLLTLWAIWKRGASVAWWTIDSGDTWAMLPSPAHISRIALRSKGGIVLMHDIERSPARDSFVLETTSLLLQLAEAGHFEVGRLMPTCH